MKKIEIGVFDYHELSGNCNSIKKIINTILKNVGSPLTLTNIQDKSQLESIFEYLLSVDVRFYDFINLEDCNEVDIQRIQNYKTYYRDDSKQKIRIIKLSRNGEKYKLVFTEVPPIISEGDEECYHTCDVIRFYPQLKLHTSTCAYDEESCYILDEVEY